MGGTGSLQGWTHPPKPGTGSSPENERTTPSPVPLARPPLVPDSPSPRLALPRLRIVSTGRRRRDQWPAAQLAPTGAAALPCAAASRTQRRGSPSDRRRGSPQAGDAGLAQAGGAALPRPSAHLFLLAGGCTKPELLPLLRGTAVRRHQGSICFPSGGAAPICFPSVPATNSSSSCSSTTQRFIQGTAHDALILRDALERENGLRVPQGKFYLVDAGYGAKPGFLPPFRGVRATMDASEGQGGTNGTATWGPMQSAFMLSYLANLVASGAKTSSGFKMSHYNVCAKAINEKFNSKYKGEHVKNHLRTWSRKFQRMNKLKNISAAGWDENNFIITLDEEHYNSYVADHKPDAEYLNKPLEHYGLMQTIFGNSMAKGKYAKDSSSNLGTEPVDVENEEVQEQKEVEFSDASAIPSTHGPIPSEQGATSASRPKSKRARRAESEEEAMLAVFKDVGDNIAKAIEKVAAPPPPPPTNDLPDDLFDMVQSIPGFQPAHYDLYFGYLVENPHIGRAFYKLPFASKLTWLSAFVSQRFAGH
ncbi:hypothetical protein U9M48_024826 [Paspalum notatum var. saurae]|uniref:Myb/SANT-like domain-containing protein n=1 Tax=Paspalum notatum var. saurae TaxID=547442 RepID=A0AAQ3TTR7_PASNO